MPITSWKEGGAFLKRQLPDLITKRRLNFITIHYLYMMGMSLIVSVVLFGIGNMAYIDALFFATGSCTQSGLNTIDINLIRTGQQITLYLAAMFCNPIAVHSFVVFVRLYWFEKRFKDIVREARLLRRTKSKSRNNTMQKDDPEQGRIQLSVRGKKIQILRHTGHSTENGMQDEKYDVEVHDKSASSSDNSKTDSYEVANRRKMQAVLPPAGRNRKSSSSSDLILPQSQSTDEHIRFLESQRNPTDTTTLRIPSPREFDRGGKPKNIENESDEQLDRFNNASHVDGLNETANEMDARLRAPPIGNHLTFDEPNIMRAREKTTTFPRPNPKQNVEEEEPKPMSRTKSRRTTFSTFRKSPTGEKSVRSMEPTPYLSYEPTIGRNSFFVNLTEEQREELGGIEYRALKTLALILVIYFFAFHLIGILCLVPWIYRTPTYGAVVTNQGQARAWWGIFTAASMFNDLGFTLTNDSMIEFGTAVFPMLLGTFLIVIGNTGFPCMLRFVIWVCSTLVPPGSAVWEELQFLLDHPRRCFTLLFPRAATWWLFAILVILNGVDLIFFIVLDLDDEVISVMPAGIKFIDGLFQASSTRTAGFSVVNLALLHPAIQVSYLIMMYISVFPIAISMRRTNVYEEKSLGIYGTKEDQEADDQEPSYVGAHLRKQLSFDLWYVFLGMFIIAIVEGKHLQNTNEYSFTLFSVLFEIVSAYGTVGLSLGYPNINASFSAKFAVLSKLVIIAMQIRGRHRGLPYELDRAILLPSESMHEKEAKEAERIMSRRRSSVSHMGAYNAVDGAIESMNFRRETGLASGHDHQQAEGGNGTTPEPKKSHSNSTLGQVAELHKRRARTGLGSAMFKIASAPGKMKDVMMSHD